MDKIIKSKKRVKDHWEVFTPAKIVYDMVDLTAVTISKKYLEPSCWNGNFLVEILKRKLSLCKKDKYQKSDLVKSLCSLYGIDLLDDNVIECRSRLLELVIQETWYHDMRPVFSTIIVNNIIQWDFLSMKNNAWGDIWFYNYELQNTKIITSLHWLKDML
jgi:hypothetical protein